jgi:heme iron utilization protein
MGVMEPGRSVRELLRGAGTAALGTSLRGGAGQPFTSLVLVGTAAEGHPVLLLSDLAEHAKNIAADARVSLLVTGGPPGTLAAPRATIIGRAVPGAAEAARARFLARHPEAEIYAGFADFRFYTVRPESAHWIAGFARARSVSEGLILADPPELLEADILAHMNADHREAVGLYATKLLRQGPGDWRMVGIDAEGADLRSDSRLVRLPFDEPIHNADGARTVLVALARQAREAH